MARRTKPAPVGIDRLVHNIRTGHFERLARQRAAEDGEQAALSAYNQHLQALADRDPA